MKYISVVTTHRPQVNVYKQDFKSIQNQNSMVSIQKTGVKT